MWCVVRVLREVVAVSEALVRIGSPSHFGEFVAGADFCSDPCRDDYLAANTDTAPEDA